MAVPRIPRRRRVFVGAEGESERAFAAWLRRLCDDRGLHLHLDVFVAGGGDGAGIVRRCAERCEKGKPYVRRLVLLDADRIPEDRTNDRAPEPVAAKADIDLILLEPSLEGVLLRLHKGQETRKPARQNTESELRKLWPDYRKPPKADDLEKRFDLGDLRRAAKRDAHLRKLLEGLGLA